MRIKRIAIFRALDMRESEARTKIQFRGTEFLGCDLRGVAFSGDLTDTTFRGCRLDGTSFAGTTGTRVWVEDCVVTDGPRPILEGHDIGELIVRGGNVGDGGWSPEIVSAIADALSGDTSTAVRGLWNVNSRSFAA